MRRSKDDIRIEGPRGVLLVPVEVLPPDPEQKDKLLAGLLAAVAEPVTPGCGNTSCMCFPDAR